MPNGLAFAKFFTHESVVIERVIRQSQIGGGRFFRPAGLLVGTAFGAGFGVARDIRAAVRANFRRRFQIAIWDFGPAVYEQRLAHRRQASS